MSQSVFDDERSSFVVAKIHIHNNSSSLFVPHLFFLTPAHQHHLQARRHYQQFYQPAMSPTPSMPINRNLRPAYVSPFASHLLIGHRLTCPYTAAPWEASALGQTYLPPYSSRHTTTMIQTTPIAHPWRSLVQAARAGRSLSTLRTAQQLPATLPSRAVAGGGFEEGRRRALPVSLYGHIK